MQQRYATCTIYPVLNCCAMVWYAVSCVMCDVFCHVLFCLSYLSSIDSAHNNLHIPINLKKNSQASHVTFASPMLYNDDDDDEMNAIPVRTTTTGGPR